ncbi:hypothetical protein ACCC97_21240, partial [Variovorax sp. Varisp85]|uniref:hypothetical protein n=1 Tax=Variovorax sp. Varisp85 TaxID=3243059 RepID=UPI0039A58098
MFMTVRTASEQSTVRVAQSGTGDSHRINDASRLPLPMIRECASIVLFVGFRRSLTLGGADKNLDWFYAASPRLTRYSMGLR